MLNELTRYHGLMWAGCGQKKITFALRSAYADAQRDHFDATADHKAVTLWRPGDRSVV